MCELVTNVSFWVETAVTWHIGWRYIIHVCSSHPLYPIIHVMSFNMGSALCFEPLSVYAVYPIPPHQNATALESQHFQYSLNQHISDNKHQLSSKMVPRESTPWYGVGDSRLFSIIAQPEPNFFKKYQRENQRKSMRLSPCFIDHRPRTDTHCQEIRGFPFSTITVNSFLCVALCLILKASVIQKSNKIGVSNNFCCSHEVILHYNLLVVKWRAI